MKYPIKMQDFHPDKKTFRAMLADMKAFKPVFNQLQDGSHKKSMEIIKAMIEDLKFKVSCNPGADYRKFRTCIELVDFMNETASLHDDLMEDMKKPGYTPKAPRPADLNYPLDPNQFEPTKENLALTLGDIEICEEYFNRTEKGIYEKMYLVYTRLLDTLKMDLSMNPDVYPRDLESFQNFVKFMNDTKQQFIQIIKSQDRI